MPGGLYLIRLSSTHFYGGRAVDFRRRWKDHLAALQAGVHCNAYMQRVYDLHHQFEPEVLELLESDLTAREQAWLDANFGSNGCVNLSPHAVGGGHKHSEEAKAKMRKPKSAETRQRISEASKGKKMSDAAKRKMSENQLGRTHSAERREKNSVLRRGVPKSEETRQRISEARKGCAVSAETRLRMSEAAKARWAKRET